MKFFIDENMPPHLAEGLAILEKPNNDGVEVYSIQKEFGRGVQDEEWIPKVGSVNGIVITQDYNIQRTQQQYELLRKYKMGIFYLRPPGKKLGYKYWEMVQKIINHWEEIKELGKGKFPFAYRIMPKGKIEKLN